MEEKKAIGLVISELRKQKKISVIELAARLGVTRQTVYETMENKVSMSIDEMSRWAKALEVDLQFLVDSAAGGAVKVQNRSVDNGNFGNEVLQNIQKLLEEEIKEKNDQIRALQEALRESQKMASALLGKSHEYSHSSVKPWVSFPGQGIRK